MSLVGICTGTSYCHIVLVDWQASNTVCRVLGEANITKPSSYTDEGAILEYFRAEVDTFLTPRAADRESVEGGGAWTIEFRNRMILDNRRISLRIEGVVLASIFRHLGAELEQLRKRSIFAAKRLGGIDISDVEAVRAMTNQSNEHTCRAISAALASTMG